MNAIIIVILVILLTTGCSSKQKVDQCLRQELFTRCLTAIPAGPAVTKYNDWDEVVAMCDSIAYRQSIRLEAPTKACSSEL